jgi:deoxyinosine 3'endonuclease (endonuclease V)
MSSLIAIFDAAYMPDAAGVGCVLAEGWTASDAAALLAGHVPGAPQVYEPGSFHKRELPLLLAMIQELQASRLRPSVHLLRDARRGVTECAPG